MHVSYLLKVLVDSTTEVSSSAQAVLQEVTGIGICLDQLKLFLMGEQKMRSSRKSLIMVEQVIILLTDCVSTFSELEHVMETVKTDPPLRIIDRLKWPMKEAAISKLLTRLHASKTSLTLMLTALSCSSVDEAYASIKDLNDLVQQVLKSNLDMSWRLKNLERMHPAFAASLRPSRNSVGIGEVLDEVQIIHQPRICGFTFEEDLKTSPVYRKVDLNEESKYPVSISTVSNHLSLLSGLSLSEVTNVSDIALPILPMELWNHHRYSHEVSKAAGLGSSPFEAWYNPPAGKTAFIRTSYFNGQYTNQYAQSKFTGHLMYRRFCITNPKSPPAFIEGAVMVAQSHQEITVRLSKTTEEERMIENMDISQQTPAIAKLDGKSLSRADKGKSPDRPIIMDLPSSSQSLLGWTQKAQPQQDILVHNERPDQEPGLWRVSTPSELFVSQCWEQNVIQALGDVQY